MIARQGRLTGWKRLALAAVTSYACLVPLFAQSRTDTFAGRRLEDALRSLQTRGLRLVFSSELVTPDMRVKTEPIAPTPEGQLSELLEPHGLVPESGPGGVIQIVGRKRSAGERPRTPVAPAPSKAAGSLHDGARSSEQAYQERITVFPNLHGPGGGSLDAERRLGSNELSTLGSHIADDPLRVVQAMPGVAGSDDFRSEYSVRGSAYHHATVVVDGIAAPWLQHAAPGRGDTGTMTMLRGDMVQDASLLVGAYPRKDGSQLGPQLLLTLREGSRTSPHFAASVSGTTTSLTAEGPVGQSARGSWLVGVRRSHVEWPVGRQDEQSTVFGFSDLQSKFVYDVRPNQEVSLSVVAGVSNVEREAADPLVLGDGVNRAGMIGLGWRSVIGSQTVVTQRISSLTHQFLNRDRDNQPATAGRNAALGYRVDLSRPVLRGVVEAGTHLRQVRGSRHGGSMLAPDPEASTVAVIDRSWLERSAYVSFRRGVGHGVTLGAGIRAAGSTLVGPPAVDRWLMAEWAAGPRWLVHGSTGVMHQFPALDQVAWTSRASGHGTGMRLERATFVDLGVGRRMSPSVRWDATVFTRREQDALTDLDLLPQSTDGAFGHEVIPGLVAPGLSGSARGLELKITRRSAAGISGWVGYAYGVARYSDSTRGETFPADFDQRHAVNVAGSVVLPGAIRAGLTFRGGTNFPVPGYLRARGGQVFASDTRNELRLPAYARLDLRAERTLHYAGRRFTLFGEALNVLNRANVGPANGVVRHDTDEALGVTERLFPRLLTAGIRFEF